MSSVTRSGITSGSSLSPSSTASGWAALAIAGPAPAQAPDPPTIVVENGLTQPVFSFANAIEQRVWIQTEVDTDGDGALDRVLADLSRPRETETEGFKVPVVFEHSPYREDVWG